MMKKINVFIFMTMLLLGLILNIAIPDKAISISERRSLAPLPSFSVDGLMDGSLMDDYESYALDQFIFRDFFLGIKAYTEVYGFRKKDVNGIYLHSGHLMKRIMAANDPDGRHFISYVTALADKVEGDGQVYFALIPDKNYFGVTDHQGTVDYERLSAGLEEGLNDFVHIDIKDLLSLEDYYFTDTHWRQESIVDVAERLITGMGKPYHKTVEDYTQITYDDFLGVYAQQSGIHQKGETLTYLTAESLESLTVYDFEQDAYMEGPYDIAALGGIDSYDVFLGGATPIVTITNEAQDSEKALIIFRDSFASCLVPLMAESYGKITLVDTRYISASLLDRFVMLEDQDILFLYNTELVVNSLILRP